MLLDPDNRHLKYELVKLERLKMIRRAFQAWRDPNSTNRTKMEYVDMTRTLKHHSKELKSSSLKNLLAS